MICGSVPALKPLFMQSQHKSNSKNISYDPKSSSGLSATLVSTGAYATLKCTSSNEPTFKSRGEIEASAVIDLEMAPYEREHIRKTMVVEVVNEEAVTSGGGPAQVVPSWDPV